MFKNGSPLPDSRIVATVRQLPVRREISVGAVMKVRSRWPFTVESGYGAISLQSSEPLSTGHKGGSSFVT